MFCPECGESLPADAQFCTECGTATDAYAAAEPAVTRKKFRPWMAGASALAVIVVVAAVLLFVRASPLLAASRSMTNFQNELSERLESTPLQAFGLLMNSFSHGTVNVNFTYADRWSTARVNASLASNAQRGEYALSGNVNVDSVNLDFSTYLNRDRVAFGSRQIGRDYYGFRFATFRDDIRPFGRELGLSNSDMDNAADIVEAIGDSLRSGSTFADYYSDYTAALVSLFRNAEQVTNRVDVRVGGSTINARRVEYTFSDDAIINLLYDLVDIFENDENMLDAFNGPFVDSGISMSHRDMVRTLRDAVRTIERNFSGYVTLTFYIGNRDRMLRIDLSGDLVIYGDRFEFEIILDLGESATDTWELDMTFRFDRERVNVRIIWDYREANGNHVHTIEISGRDIDTIELRSDWDPVRGDFILSAHERSRWGTWDFGSIDGNFTTDGETFSLRFDQDTRDGHWALEISTERGAAIGTIDFINIDQWTLAWLERIEDVLWDLGF